MDELTINAGSSLPAITNELSRVRRELTRAEGKYQQAAEILEKSEKTFMFPTWAVIVGLFFYVIPSVAMIAFNSLVSKPKKKALESEALSIANEADHIMTQINTGIPQKYLFVTCIDYALELANTGRANSLPELCDRLDEQLHRWTMEAQNDQILAQQMAMNQSMGQVSVSSGISAAASVINLFR